ncbi:MAG TPA: hypothetical protein VGH94_09070 [Acidimicrobiales bacterium]
MTAEAGEKVGGPAVSKPWDVRPWSMTMRAAAAVWLGMAFTLVAHVR